MKLKRVKAFALYNLDKTPVVGAEELQFRSMEGAIKAQSFYGGTIRSTYIHEKG